MTDKTNFFSIDKPKVRLSTPEYIYAKLVLIYAAIYVVAFAAGCLMLHFLDLPRSQSIDLRILNYFSIDFSGCNNIFDAALLIFSICKTDLYHLALIFCAGFTMLSGLILSSLLIFRAFSLGFSLCYLSFALREGYVNVEHPAALLVLYSILCAISTVILLHCSVKSAIFCDEFKALCGQPRKIIRSKSLYAHIYRFLISVGALMIINLIRTFL